MDKVTLEEIEQFRALCDLTVMQARAALERYGNPEEALRRLVATGQVRVDQIKSWPRNLPLPIIDASRFSDAVTFSRLRRTACHQKVDKREFYPVGLAADRARDVDVYYMADPGATPDQKWLDERLPNTVLQKIVAGAFERHVGPGLSHEEVTQDLVIGLGFRLSREDRILLFERLGFLPFFEITAVVFWPETDGVIVFGRTYGITSIHLAEDLDTGVAERGLSISLSKGGVNYEHGRPLREGFDWAPPALVDARDAILGRWIFDEEENGEILKSWGKKPNVIKKKLQENRAAGIEVTDSKFRRFNRSGKVTEESDLLGCFADGKRLSVRVKDGQMVIPWTYQLRADGKIREENAFVLRKETEADVRLREAFAAETKATAKKEISRRAGGLKEKRIEIDPAAFSPTNLKESPWLSAFHQALKRESLFPIGERVEDAEDIDVFYVRGAASEPDEAWMKKRLPAELDKLADLIRQGFDQYCGPDWCGADMKEEILEELQDDSTYPADSADLFRAEGYLPFLQIEGIEFYPTSDAVLINGRCPIDGNLEEHGFSVKISKEGVVFGYASDFSEDLARESWEAELSAMDEGRERDASEAFGKWLFDEKETRTFLQERGEDKSWIKDTVQYGRGTGYEIAKDTLTILHPDGPQQEKLSGVEIRGWMLKLSLSDEDTVPMVFRYDGDTIADTTGVVCRREGE